MLANCRSARTVTSRPVMLSTTIRPRGSGARGEAAAPGSVTSTISRRGLPLRLPQGVNPRPESVPSIVGSARAGLQAHHPDRVGDLLRMPRTPSCTALRRSRVFDQTACAPPTWGDARGRSERLEFLEPDGAVVTAGDASARIDTAGQSVNHTSARSTAARPSSDATRSIASASLSAISYASAARPSLPCCSATRSITSLSAKRPSSWLWSSDRSAWTPRTPGAAPPATARRCRRDGRSSQPAHSSRSAPHPRSDRCGQPANDRVMNTDGLRRTDLCGRTDLASLETRPESERPLTNRPGPEGRVDGRHSVRKTMVSAPVGLVTRTRLLDLLDRAPEPALVLVCAPPGYGKTYLLADWFVHRASSTAAWLALDEDDNDPRRFWGAVLAAMWECAAVPDDSVLRQLSDKSPASIADLAGEVIDALDNLPEPVWLVLDNVDELMAPEAQDALRALLRHRPRGLRLVLASRLDPPLSLPRLRLEGRLHEIRVDRLGFSPDRGRGASRGCRCAPRRGPDHGTAHADWRVGRGAPARRDLPAERRQTPIPFSRPSRVTSVRWPSTSWVRSSPASRPRSASS